jgi:hypothetical protein
MSPQVAAGLWSGDSVTANGRAFCTCDLRHQMSHQRPPNMTQKCGVTVSRLRHRMGAPYRGPIVEGYAMLAWESCENSGRAAFYVTWRQEINKSALNISVRERGRNKYPRKVIPSLSQHHRSFILHTIIMPALPVEIRWKLSYMCARRGRKGQIRRYSAEVHFICGRELKTCQMPRGEGLGE